MKQGVRILRFSFSIFLGVILSCSQLLAADYIIIQSTTSTRNSGLLEAILPQFTQQTGFQARVVSVGTGQALRNAQNGDGDVLLVHAKDAEIEFVAQGWGLARYDVMYNDFLIAGPHSDPAGIAGGKNAVEALEKIANSKSVFVSRGDDSGTHKAELRLWSETDVDLKSASGSWYRETGSGMGATLNMATSVGAYVMTDRATWLSFKNRGNLQVLIEGDDRLFNQYGVIAVNSERHPRINAAGAKAFVNWITGAQGQAAIGQYTLGGKALFFPNAKR